MVTPANPLDIVRRLAADPSCCSVFRPVLVELRRHGLDLDDLREIVCSDLGEAHCFRTKPTEKYDPATMSDDYSLWIEECGVRMFLKLLVADGQLVITSFKKDDRYA